MMTSPADTLGALSPATEVTIAISSTPAPVNTRSIPNSRADLVMNSRTEYWRPVEMTKSSGVSCCSIHPLHTDVVFGVAPVAQRVDFAHKLAFLIALGDVGQATGDLAGYEGFAAARAFVIEQEAIASIDTIGFGSSRRSSKHRAWPQHRGCAGRKAWSQTAGSRPPYHTARRWTPDRSASSFPAPKSGSPLANAGCPSHRHQRCIRCLEADRNMALRAEVVDLVRLDFGQDASQVRAVGQIAVVQPDLGVGFMRILIDVVDALRVQGRGAALDACTS